MPDLRSLHLPFLTLAQPDAKNSDGSGYPTIRYYPGLNVSVQFGLPPTNTRSAGETRARLILLLEINVGGEGASPPFFRDGRFAQLQLPAVIVLAAGEPDIAEALMSEQIVTLFVEPRFLRETASSDVTGVTVGDLAELVRKDGLVAPLTDVFRKLAQCVHRRNSQYVEAVGIVMAAHVLHHLFDGQASADRRSGLTTEAEQRVVAYIDVHYTDEFDVDALARVSGYSRNHFQRLFKKTFKQTPRDYIRGCQVQHAITLLQTTSLKGMDVALACGFCDETQMARWFVKLRGCLPSQVREATRW